MSLKNGGGRGLQTIGMQARSTVFETFPLNHSGTQFVDANTAYGEHSRTHSAVRAF